MFAVKSRTKAASSVLLIAVFVFNTFIPTTVSVKPDTTNDARSLKANSSNLASNITLGASDFSTDKAVPILAEQIAKENQQVQTEDPIRLKLKVEPAIYTPGMPITLSWEVKNLKAADLPNAVLVFHTQPGVLTADANPIYTPDGLITVPLESKKNASIWNVQEGTQLPIYFAVDLLINDDLVVSEPVMVDRAKFSIEKDKSGIVKGLNGKVEIDVPANATDESLSIDIREPSPQAQPPVSLTWEPSEIIAIGKDSQKNVNHFKSPIKIKIKYDKDQIGDWDEKALTIYYYDPDVQDWFPIDTTVDTKNQTLTALSDHLTVFDYKANNWQSQSLPTVDAFKVSDFTGAGTYALNIWTPPGQGGLQPSLTLSYNSQVIDESSAYSQPSWVGMGWDLDTGSITRNMHGTDSDTSDDTFSISVAGVSGILLPTSVSAPYTYFNTADQSFMKVRFDGSTWTVWGRDGTQYIFSTRAQTNSTNGCSSTLDLT